MAYLVNNNLCTKKESSIVDFSRNILKVNCYHLNKFMGTATVAGASAKSDYNRKEMLSASVSSLA